MANDKKQKEINSEKSKALKLTLDKIEKKCFV